MMMMMMMMMMMLGSPKSTHALGWRKGECGDAREGTCSGAYKYLVAEIEGSAVAKY